MGLGDGFDRTVACPGGEIDGHVLLNGDFMSEVFIIREIGNAKATLTENLPNFVPVQLSSRLQGIEMTFFSFFVHGDNNTGESASVEYMAT